MVPFTKRLIFGAVILVILVVGILMLRMYSASKTTRDFSQSPTTFVSRLKPEEIARLLLQWANNKRTENGGYAEGEICLKNGTCEPLIADNRIGAVGLWARYRSYLRTKGFETMAIISQDLRTYTDPNKVSTIQPHFWNCKLIFELWKSANFTPEQKDQLQVICARSIYNTFDLSFPDNTLVEETAQLQVTQEMDGKRISGELIFPEVVDPDRLYEYAINSSERTSMWEWASDPADLQQAHLYFMGAVEALRALQESERGEHAPLVGIAALDLYRATPSPAFADYARYLFETYKDTKCVYLENCALRAYFYNELLKLENKESYRQERDKVLNAMYDQRFDREGLKGYSLGKQAYYDNEYKNRYWMVSNSLIAGLLLDLR